MSDTEKDRDQEKGDEVLKRMLKTPPKPHEGRKDNNVKARSADKSNSGKGE